MARDKIVHDYDEQDDEEDDEEDEIVVPLPRTRKNSEQKLTEQKAALAAAEKLVAEKEKEKAEEQKALDQLYADDLPMVSKDRIKDMLRRLDAEQRLDADVENLVVELIDDFVANISRSSLSLCRHRQSDTVEAQDAQLIAEKNYNIRVPGFGVDGPTSQDFLAARKRKVVAKSAKVDVIRDSARKAGVLKRQMRTK